MLSWIIHSKSLPKFISTTTYYLFFILLFLSFKYLDCTTVEMKSGKIFVNVKIKDNKANIVEIIDKDGVILQLNKDSIKSIHNDSNSKETENVKDEILQTPITGNLKEKKEFSILFNQSIGNDAAFQGSSLFGERQSRRNNESYKSFNEAWNLSTGIDLLGLAKNLQIGFTLLNPLVDRSNTDSDNNYQNSPGSISRNKLILDSISSQSILFDPSETKLRKEKNGLIDFLFSRINYEHPTIIGSFGIGFIFINSNTPIYTMRSIYVISYRPPFLKYFNPHFTINNRLSYETLGTYQTAGLYQGIHNYRLTLSHEYFFGDKIRITPSVVFGYQDVNNNINMKKGISDISPRLQLNYSSLFFALNYMMRLNTNLVDNQYYYPNIGYYPDTNQNDGKTVDPSKVNGPINNFIVENLNSSSNDQNIKKYLVEKYQHQKILHGILFFNLGYTLKF